MKHALVLIGLGLLLVSCAAPPVNGSEEPPPALALVGTNWVMKDADAPANARMPTIEFNEASRAVGFSGCNQWFAQAETANGGLRFSSVGMTRRACPEPAMTIEREFGEMLGQTRSVQMDGADLVLFGEEAEEIGRFSPAT